MRKIVLVLAAMCTILSASLLPERSSVAREQALIDGSANRIRAHLLFLADDQLEGRQTGMRGYDLAARYVASQFAAAGLSPGGADGDWYQIVPLVEAAPVIPAAEVTLLRSGATEALVVTEDFLPSPDVNAADISIEAPLVFAGFGVHAPDLDYDDFKHVDVRGKIAVILTSAPARFRSTERAHYSAAVTKFPELVRRGAVGVLQVQTPDDSRRYPWQFALLHSWRPRLRWLDAQGVAADSYPQLRAVASMSQSGAERLFAGAPQSLAAIFAAADRGNGVGFDLPGTARIKRQSLLAKRSSPNVLGLLRGSDPRFANEYLVVTAHLDHVGKGAPVAGDSIYNGALDNASGVSVMLEMARALAVSSRRPRRSILFAAVTGEESGLLGSDYLARHPPFREGRYVANLNFDMPVMLTEIADIVGYGAEHTSLGPALQRATNTEGIVLSPDPTPEETIFVRSDQYSFIRQGVPAIFPAHGMMALPRTPAVDTKALVEKFMRSSYHKPDDDLNQPIHYPSLARLSRIGVRLVTEVANSKTAPTWNQDSFLGATFARRN